MNWQYRYRCLPTSWWPFEWSPWYDYPSTWTQAHYFIDGEPHPKTMYGSTTEWRTK